jgi:hypothetical protein
MGIDAKVLPDGNPEPHALCIIYLDENVGVDDPTFGLTMCPTPNSKSFGFHYFFTTKTGKPFCYGLIPSLSDACVRDTCSSSPNCILNLNQTQEQRLTEMTSHLFAVISTNPFINGWYNPDAGDVGTICDGESDTITGKAGIWTVQKIYSKADDLTGSAMCIGQAPQPRPVLSGGPSTASQTHQHTITSTERLLPLPPRTIDTQTKRVTIQEPDLHHYARKLFYPLSNKALVALNVPDLLRQFADFLEKEEK